MSICLNYLNIKGDFMSMLLRSLLVLGMTSLLVVGCGEKEEAAPVEEAPVAESVEAPAPVAPVSGGYEPSADERVPGITLDPAQIAAETEAAATASAGEVASFADSEPQ
jgi:hypothetical protein